MKHSWMSAVAVAALTAGLTAAHAQSPNERKRPEPQSQGQGQSPTPSRTSEQPSAKQEKQEGAATQGSREVKSGSEPQGGAAAAKQSGSAQKEDSRKAGTAQKDDASRSTRSGQGASEQDRKRTQTPDRDSRKPGERTGSQGRDDGATAQSRERDNERAVKRDRDSESAGRRDRDGDRDRSADDRDRDRKGDRVQFSERERTTIQDSIRREKVERTNINVNISVGATIPRNVTLRPLPAAIVQINPAYRSYRYVVVRDEIVIINPQTYRVVEVLPYSGNSTVRARRGTGSRSVELSTDQRRRIVTYAREECDTVLAQPDFQIDIGTRIPERIELCPFEEVVIQEVDVVRPYRFFVARDEVVLVDPSDNTIVEVIR
jgi:hypothetical protein